MEPRWERVATFGHTGGVVVSQLNLVRNKDEFFHNVVGSDEEIDPDDYPPVDDFTYQTEQVTPPEKLAPEAIYGSETLRKAIQNLCREYIDINFLEKLIVLQLEYQK
jgi:hypothetical protein